MSGTLTVRKLAIAAASIAVLAGTPAAMAQRPEELAGASRDQFRGPGGQFDHSTINGARVDSAKETLSRQGFVHARNIQANGRQYDLWWSGRTCVGFTSYNGRVTDVRSFRDEECGYYGGSGGGGAGWGGGGQGGFNARALEGLRVDSAKSTLRDRGFSYSRAIRQDGRQYDLWWSGRTCVGFTSYNGRVTDARMFNDAECGGGAAGWGGRFEVRRLEGVTVDSAKSTLRSEGFDYSRAIRIDGKQYDLWRGRDYRNGCVGFTSYNGRVTDARSFNERECY